MLGYPYRLCSYLYMSEDDRRARSTLACVEAAGPGVDWIMDSGLFSFMFGGRKGELRTFEDYRLYAIKYLKMLDEWGWKHRAVECDVQRVLGVDECNALRDEIFRSSGRDIIYVWHLPEGEEGLSALAAREKHIALSIPELRSVLGSGLKTEQAVTHLLGVIRRSGNPRVHLLGNTELRLVRMPAESGDSSSWIYGERYDIHFYFDPASRSIKQVSAYSAKWKKWYEWCQKHFDYAFEAIDKAYCGVARRVFYNHRSLSNAIAYWMLMEAFGGKKAELCGPTNLPAACLEALPAVPDEGEREASR